MEEKISEILIREKRGMSITDLVNASKSTRSAVRTALARLEGAGKVFVRQVGMAKLYYWVDEGKEENDTRKNKRA